MSHRFSLQILKSVSPLLMGCCLFNDAQGAGNRHRVAYYKNGEIHVNILGTPEVKPITQGHWDFKPSWSKAYSPMRYQSATFHSSESQVLRTTPPSVLAFADTRPRSTSGTIVIVSRVSMLFVSLYGHVPYKAPYSTGHWLRTTKILRSISTLLALIQQS